MSNVTFGRACLPRPITRHLPDCVILIDSAAWPFMFVHKQILTSWAKKKILSKYFDCQNWPGVKTPQRTLYVESKSEDLKNGF
jgi:hypothetical protein